ncbi:hypothetical protein F503_05327 [Ophiostoma piceae UAMH 11346]|uniref:Uncharacterized protein n=1 Tax=Ophiostoma piceae (strain UAMH 11346) TaxID=1262450 RepID=S3CBH2_OPHP1|nr:hypothetical protein F503_05327 [Ophiostoma piceae UAMH 11346]
MSSTATEATSSLHHNPQLAVRLSSNPQNGLSNGNQQPEIPIPVRRRPKRPAIPRHPIPSMQEAFAESLAEVTSGTLSMKPKLRVDTPQIRRDRLLDQDKSEPPPESLWRMRPAQNCHELRKLLAQIAFGVYLLLKGMANSDAQVVAILQGHIDEVDDFLKTAMEDLKLATQDLNTRLDYLKLPLGNLPAFEEMLEDREFRLRIVEGNVRIEHILSRTTTALTQTVDDVSEGLRSTKEFTTYLSAEEHGAWRVERPAEVTDIFEAMRGNAEGWLNAFADLEEKTNTLDLLISKLADMVTEMDRCAGEVSRRTRFSIKPFTLPELTSRVSQDSQDSSFQSYEATPPLSPSNNVPQMPPRLSIRFSALGDILAPTTFLDSSSSSRNPPLGTEQLLSSLQYTPPAEVSEQKLAPEIHTTLRPTQYTPEPTQKRSVSTAPTSPGLSTKGAEVATSNSHTTTIRDADAAVDSTVESDDMPVSLYINVDTANEESFEAEASDSADTPTGPIPVHREGKKDDGETLFMLQPRTYTPQASPLPSPRVVETSKPASPREVLLAPRSRGEGASPRLIIPSTESRQSYKSPTSPMSSVSYGGSFSTVRESSTVVSPADSVSSERTIDSDFNSGIPKKKTSIRERVSLRTTPPDAIQVPPPNAPQLQRPVFASPRTYQNYRTFTAPDSAYSSENDRTTSIAFQEATPTATPTNLPMTSGSHDYSPPSFPNIVPSPHSDQQYFRPVQASPHSPLQQRPHTAGQVPTRPHHLRNAPSSMGMSMLSNMTTMTQDSKGQRMVKKKRSAFGWLKKAFTLDDDERIAYEQRKQAEERNLYYDTRSPKFLDGKRIR